MDNNRRRQTDDDNDGHCRRTICLFDLRAVVYYDDPSVSTGKPDFRWRQFVGHLSNSVLFGMTIVVTNEHNRLRLKKSNLSEIYDWSKQRKLIY